MPPKKIKTTWKPLEWFERWMVVDSIDAGIESLRRWLIACITVHLIIGVIVLGVGIKVDVGNYVFYNQLEVKQNAPLYQMPIVSLSSFFFFLEAAFCGMELYYCRKPQFKAWLLKRVSPITWFGYAVSDAWISAIFIILEGVQGVGFILQHAFLRSIMNLSGGWLSEHWASIENPKVGRETLFDPRNLKIPWRPFLVGFMCYGMTILIRWMFMIVAAVDNDVPVFVWVSFASYHTELFFPLALYLSLSQRWIFRNYLAYKKVLLFISLMIKTSLGLTITFGAYFRTTDDTLLRVANHIYFTPR